MRTGCSSSTRPASLRRRPLNNALGVLAAALWNPVLTTSIDGLGDVVFAAGLLVLLRVLPVWAVVPLAAVAGALVF